MRPRFGGRTTVQGRAHDRASAADKRKARCDESVPLCAKYVPVFFKEKEQKPKKKGRKH